MCIGLIFYVICLFLNVLYILFKCSLILLIKENVDLNFFIFVLSFGNNRIFVRLFKKGRYLLFLSKILF